MRVLLTGCHGFIGRNVNDVLMETEGINSVICIEKGKKLNILFNTIKKIKR